MNIGGMHDRASPELAGAHMTIGGTNLTEGLGFLGIGIAIVAVVALVIWLTARRRGTSGIALGATLAIAQVWLFLLVIAIPFALYNTLIAPELSVTVHESQMWPVHFPATPTTLPAVLDGSFGDSSITVVGTTLGPRAVLAAAQIAQIAVLAAPAVMLSVAMKHALDGSPFAPAVPRWFIIGGVLLLVAGGAEALLSEIGNVLAASEVYPIDTTSSASFTLGESPHFQLIFPWWPLLASLVCAALAAVFRHGARLQEDTEGLV
ncbi:MAG: hypothetical protein ACTH9L_08955 [Microbacterium gubbeenense]